ncbi:MAG: peptidoglycan-binding protein LysM [Actinomycetota bacterium]
MGLIEFVKEAGEKIFGADEPKAAPPKVPKAGSTATAMTDAATRAKALRDLVKKLGLQVEGLRVSVSGHTATVHGKVDSQAEREKVILAVGNVAGIAVVEDKLESVHDGATAQMYTVIKGDTLSEIAQRFYGDPMKYPTIFEANRPQLEDPDKIYPGQVLRIPHTS